MHTCLPNGLYQEGAAIPGTAQSDGTTLYIQSQRAVRLTLMRQMDPSVDDRNLPRQSKQSCFLSTTPDDTLPALLA